MWKVLVFQKRNGIWKSWREKEYRENLNKYLNVLVVHNINVKTSPPHFIFKLKFLNFDCGDSLEMFVKTYVAESHSQSLPK
jgi:hypothetical protein